MNREIYQIELITPCFCAGADQSIAEIRAPSIRGQLRWWFRVLGGTPTDEGAIFGSVAGEKSGASSSLIVRVGEFKKGPSWQPPIINQNTPENYVWHFASVSGKTSEARATFGPRWTSTGAISPGSTFKLHLTWLRSITPAQRVLFDKALHAFLTLGTLGLRGSRGLGAINCTAGRTLEEQLPDLQKAGLVIRKRNAPDTFPTCEKALKDYSAWLRFDLRKKRKADHPSPLGGIVPKRQASAVRFRPIKLATDQFTWIAFEVPHGKVLNLPSRTHDPLLANYEFTGPPPPPPEHQRRR
jgi:CRISPR type III-B/RAMP module RAMP protein Cmr1